MKADKAKRLEQFLQTKLNNPKKGKRESEDTLAHEESTYAVVRSDFTIKILKSEKELNRAKSELEKAVQQVEAAEKEITLSKEEVVKVMGEAEILIAKAREETESKTSSNFLYILWEVHSELDFSFFGEETVAEVKKYKEQAVCERTQPGYPLKRSERSPPGTPQNPYSLHAGDLKGLREVKP